MSDGHLKTPFVLEAGGCLAVPQGPGLGIELDPVGMEQLLRRPWSEQRR
jgi:L-alanine-DL-glutamate epimerase-like enolase superfamily enzyme